MSEKENRIGKDFDLFGLIRFGIPAFCMNTFSQLFHSLDDALFVSRFVGESALASINILNPIQGLLVASQHLFSLGSSNISARLMGEGKQQEAKEVFSREVVAGGVYGLIFALILNVFAYPILNFLGADSQTASYAIYQFRLVFSIIPITLINQVFSCYYSTAGKPNIGMICAIVNGVTNIGLDIILVAILDLGILGVSIATAAGDIAVFIIGLFFYSNKKNEIYFVKVVDKFVSTTLESAKYAFPQVINSASFSVTALITNKIILKMMGSTGIACNGIVSDIRKIVASGLIGLAACYGPILAYNYGSNNHERLQKIAKYIIKIWGYGSIIITLIGLGIRKPLIDLFMSKTTTIEFFNMSMEAVSIELLATPFVCGCIFMNRSLIALSRPKQALVLSVFRNLIAKAIVTIVLPIIFGELGIWASHPVSEAIAFSLGVYIIYTNRNMFYEERC